MRSFDVIILGLGANGSAALYHLSRHNKNILGIDRFTPPHASGSSHGESRIIRQAYYENPVYVPFVKEAYRLWREIESLTGKKLLLKTGGLMLGNEHATVISGSITSARLHHIAYEYLQADGLKNRFPAFAFKRDTVGVLEQEAGILSPEECIRTFLEESKNKGATVNYNETAIRFVPGKNSITLITDRGAYTTSKLIISAGAWNNKLLYDLDLPLTVDRQVQYWFKSKDPRQQHLFLPENLPVYIWEYERGKMFYGFPDLGNGVKIACHQEGRLIEPDALRQNVSKAEISGIEQLINQYFNADMVFEKSAVCMYTSTPDKDFIIDRHPAFENVIIASPCSGHGFKFSSLTGRLLSDMAQDRPLDFDLTPFRIGRFSVKRR